MAASYTIPVLEKAFAVIGCISEHDDGLTLSDIVKKLEAPKSTVFKILHTLEKELILEKMKDRYFLGSMLIHYGLHTLSQRDLKTVSRPFLNALMNETGETAHLAVPVGMQTMILDVELTTHPIRFTSPVGSLFPLYCTSHGKLFLAYSEDYSFDEYISENTLCYRTKYTITDPETLRTELDVIKKQGFSMDEVEFIDDIRCCAAPVFDDKGSCIGAIGITSTTITFGKERIDEISKSVKKIAMKISAEMGHSGSRDRTV
ncbi:IclR family transcriptional regulator [Oceanispirochaeta sp.]|jgi:DNA-binding IclR family transcriptional regulator|uniref:IclR family transcriptional regulator n=1 Tax=Oceanispirochaeta sp. TaxID=2035350 RepID=UPI0026133C03|nr:IclR family transcriptional regulator [Oceanispirochaeta sp.]MDA3956338.1 IclR family transcriptional regulator [Oceanispirochaeta sp.]